VLTGSGILVVPVVGMWICCIRTPHSPADLWRAFHHQESWPLGRDTVVHADDALTVTMSTVATVSSRTPKPATLRCVLPSSSEDCTVSQSVQYFISTLVTVLKCKSGRTLTDRTYLLTYLLTTVDAIVKVVTTLVR